MIAPIELLQDRAYVIGDSIEIDGRVSWYPEESRGFAPSNCLLLLEPDGALLVDTGLTVHQDSIVEQVRALVGRRRLSIALTRPTEFDVMCNVAALCRAFDVAEVHSNQPIRYHAHFHPAFDDDGLTSEGPGWSQVQPITESSLPLRLSSAISIGSSAAGENRVEAILTPLRILPTFWMYDRCTQTLYTSDAFGHATAAEATGPAIFSGHAGGSAEPVAKHLLAKFEWLRYPGADTLPVRDQLMTLFAERPVKTIVPYSGLVLQGANIVERAIHDLLDGVHRDPPPASRAEA